MILLKVFDMHSTLVLLIAILIESHAFHHHVDFHHNNYKRGIHCRHRQLPFISSSSSLSLSSSATSIDSSKQSSSMPSSSSSIDTSKQSSSMPSSSSSSIDSSIPSSSRLSSYDYCSQVLQLPPTLTQYVLALRQLPHDRLKYQYLLDVADNYKMKYKALWKQDCNLVQGCMSTVYIKSLSEDIGGNNVISYCGYSNALLSKGLMVMLVDGLSNNTKATVARLTPDFLSYAGLTTSVTQTRIGGAINMLKHMQRLAVIP